MQSTPEGLRLSASDLSRYLGCRFLTQLDRAVAEGRREGPDWSSPMLALLQQRGLLHEDAYREALGQDRRVVTLADFEGAEAVERSVAAMREGADVIVQAALREGRWGGRADFLLRVPRPSELGDWSYEVVDTKLSQETRGGTVLQLCLYSELLGRIQGLEPESMFVVKPGEGFPEERFRYAEFAAYYRLIKSRLEQAVDQPAGDLYPLPVPQCDLCSWWKDCDRRRHEDDHLCLVAGIQTAQIAELNRQGITSLGQFAEAEPALKERPRRGSVEAYHKAQGQARIQLEGRRQGRPVDELLPAIPGEGFSRLPQPDAGDVFFDFEADPFVDGGGLEYLFGVVTVDGGSSRYRSSWALTRGAERAAFEEFMDFLEARLHRFPGMHVYHFAPYEPAALKRLMGRFGTRGPQLDRLLRGERFIDLHAVTKQALRASVERYSLKDLEPFFGYRRSLPLREASQALRRVEAALELGQPGDVSEEDRAAVAAYNREDCEATRALRDWLERRRAEAIAAGAPILRPELQSGEASENVEQQNAALREVFERLVAGLPEDRGSWSEEEAARWRLAHLLEYFAREVKCAWWDFFRIQDLDEEGLLDERKAVTGLEFVGEQEGGTARCPVHRYRFPAQEVSLPEERGVYEVGAEKIGAVVRVDQVARTVDVKKTQAAAPRHPRSIMVDEVVPPRPLDSSLLSLARTVLDEGLEGEGPFRAARDLLLGRAPRLRSRSADGALRREREETVDAAIRLAGELDGGVLAIQGPPGTGKTYTGARMIVDRVRAGRRVGVTAVGHKVIRNLLEGALEAAEEAGVPLRVAHKTKALGTAPDGLEELSNNAEALAALDEGKVVGGTAWLWARDDAVQQLDDLFVDEAGQMSLAQVLAAARSARNLILLGDPQQLEQPQRGAHPEGAEVAALDHVLRGRKTIPPERGLFLDRTWRLHPAIARFTSEAFYEGRLECRSGLERQAVLGGSPLAGSGLVFVPVPHEGNQTRSLEEVEVVRGLVDGLLKGHRWRDAGGVERSIEARDILVVAPYNAQVGALSGVLPDGVRVGTVDRFQGLQAPVVFYAMTSSTAEEAPRGMEFLHSPHRLNVASSRAQCLCVLVASPRLLEPSCGSPDQMRWASALCRYRELAREIELPDALTAPSGPPRR